MKWIAENLGKAAVSEHLVRVYHRPDVGGLFLSSTEPTKGAVETCREAMIQGRVVVICTLQEVVSVLTQELELQEFLQKKVTTAIAEKNPFPKT